MSQSIKSDELRQEPIKCLHKKFFTTQYSENEINL
jgi:hypothetical protein